LPERRVYYVDKGDLGSKSIRVVVLMQWVWPQIEQAGSNG